MLHHACPLKRVTINVHVQEILCKTCCKLLPTVQQCQEKQQRQLFEKSQRTTLSFWPSQNTFNGKEPFRYLNVTTVIICKRLPLQTGICCYCDYQIKATMWSYHPLKTKPVQILCSIVPQYVSSTAWTGGAPILNFSYLSPSTRATYCNNIKL